MVQLKIMPILIIFFALLTLQKQFEERHLKPSFSFRSMKRLEHFKQAEAKISPKEKYLLRLWESMLTGNSRLIRSEMSQRYELLNLKHLFTPSGLHLSAILKPLFFIIRGRKIQIFILTCFLVCLLFGQHPALTRVTVIQLLRYQFSAAISFVLAFGLELLTLAFQTSWLSFVFSFLFLGFIYAEKRYLFLWFFLGQCLVAFFVMSPISPLSLILSPVINIIFCLIMPVLFLMSFPLWDWQIKVGISCLDFADNAVKNSMVLMSKFPCGVIHLGIIFLFIFIIFKRKKMLALSLILLSSPLNEFYGQKFSIPCKEYVPQSFLIKRKSEINFIREDWQDAKCKRWIEAGRWLEKCSPLERRSTRKKIS
jgi:hypothetical protein